MKKIFEFQIIRKAGCLWLISMLTLWVAEAWSFSETPVQHNLRIELDPSSRFAKIQDRVVFKTSRNNCESFSFYLHSDLKLNRNEVPGGWRVETSNYISDDLSLLKILIVKSSSIPCPETFSMTLDYSGILLDPESDEQAGFMFSGGSYFYPQSIEGSSRVKFSMQVSLPEPWQVVSQGQCTGNKISKGKRNISWTSTHPSEEIYLIGNRFHVYEEVHN